MTPYEEEDPMDRVLALADLQGQQVAPEQDQPLPPGPTAPAGYTDAPPEGLEGLSPRRNLPQAPSAQGHVDPELAFMAAFSQNPVLQRMVEESRNRPRQQQDFDNKAASEGRASEKWQQERDIMAPLKAEGVRNKNALGASALEDTRGNTPFAKAMRDSAITQTQMLASRFASAGSPLAEQMANVARLISSNPNMAPRQIQQLLSPFGNLADKVAGDAQKAAALEASNAQHAQTNARGWATLNEQQRHNRASEEMGGQKLDLRMEKDQQKLNEKVAGLNEQDELMGMVDEQKKKVNTGYFADKIQRGLKVLGMESKEYDTLEGLVSGVSNQIIKLQAGGNVTAGEAARMRQQLPSTDMDDQEFETKLATVMNQIAIKKKNAAAEYQRKPGGGVKDAAPISKKIVDEVERPAASVNDAQDGARAYSKKAGKYFVRKGGKWVPE